MPLPANARIRVARTFVRDVRAAADFMHLQDATRAEERYERLLARLDEVRGLLRWNPASGRPARFMDAQSVHAAVIQTEARSLMDLTSLPQLRELVLKPYVLLYAHDASQVVLLALRHERQLGFHSFAG